MDCSPPGSSVHGISHSRILKWVAISFYKGSFLPRDQTCVSCDPCTGKQFFTTEPPGKPVILFTGSYKNVNTVQTDNFIHLWNSIAIASLSVLNLMMTDTALDISTQKSMCWGRYVDLEIGTGINADVESDVDIYIYIHINIVFRTTILKCVSPVQYVALK